MLPVVAVAVVKVPAAGVDPPMVVASIVPPLMSVVVRTEEAIVITPVESAIVAEAVPSLALMLVTSILVVSTVVAFTVVILPVVAVAVVKVPAAGVDPPMVAPSIVPPLISTSARYAVPSMYRSFHELPEEPKSCVLSAEGIRPEANRAVAVIVSEVAFPSVVLPSTVRLPEMLPLTIVVTHARTLVPSQKRNAVFPLGTATPVPLAVLSVTA